MGVERRQRRQQRWLLAGGCLGLFLACLRPSPAPEGAPPSPAPAEAPAAPSAPASAAPAPPPAAADRQQAPLGGEPGVGSGAPKPEPEPPESKSKKRPASPRKSSAVDLAGPEDEAPAADDLRRRLDRAYGAASPDCPSARDRKKAVCDLATQICSLTERDPNVASVAEYCDEARRRCSNAQRRTSAVCPE